ncbi:MAG: hypothetical protein QNJ46_27840 [Leptolyngbyaceae cyanobacterium MO_188.B28]|nr:hypothetical protein [Leptolyngbyaceae cyanobacterium MO_188.B28]
MANKQHLTLIRQGAADWHEWKRMHRVASPDLREADLKGLNLR